MKKGQIILFTIGIILLAGILAGCAGFDLGDLVRVKTPHAIQQQTGLPTSVTLNEAETEYQAWYADVQRSGAQWKTNIERGNEVRALLSQISLSALDEVGPTLAGVPVLGPALPAVTGLLGLFLGAGKLRKEKEASFNEGMKRAREGAPGSATATPTVRT